MAKYPMNNNILVNPVNICHAYKSPRDGTAGPISIFVINIEAIEEC